MSGQGTISFRFSYCYGSTERPARGQKVILFEGTDWDQAKQWAFTRLIEEIKEKQLEKDLSIAASLSSREGGQTVLSAEMENQDNPGAIKVADLLAVDLTAEVGSRWFRKEVPFKERKDKTIDRVRRLIDTHKNRD